MNPKLKKKAYIPLYISADLPPYLISMSSAVVIVLSLLQYFDQSTAARGIQIV